MVTDIVDICCIKHKIICKGVVRYFQHPFKLKNGAVAFYHLNLSHCELCVADRKLQEQQHQEKIRLERLQIAKNALIQKAKENSNISKRYNGVCFDSFTVEPRPIALQAILDSYNLYIASLKVFIERGRNLVAVGKKGRGKTHLAVSLLKIALSNGFTGRIEDHTTLIANCLNNYENRLLYATYDVLIIDELAVLDLQSHRNIINDLISDRYNGKKTTIINTHLPPKVTATIIDPSRKAKLFEDCCFVDFDKYFDADDNYDYRTWKNNTFIAPIEMRLGDDK